MSDPYSNLAAEDVAVQTRIADAMDTRCMEPAQVAIRRDYLSNLNLHDNAFAVEFGSGTGHVTRDLQTIAGATRALGIEPSPVMVQRAQQHYSDVADLEFETGDATNSRLADSSVDLVLMHTLLCHVPEPEAVIAEAYRVLKPGGKLAICDGDYDTSTARIDDYDPLEMLVKYLTNHNVTNLWIMRQIGALLSTSGFESEDKRGHGYVADAEARYFLTVIDRAADNMVESGILYANTARALKEEARQRVSDNKFFGYMSYVSVVAHKPIT